jgi:transposase
MAQTSCVILAPDDRERLASIIADRNRPQKHVQRARIILHSDQRLPVKEVARRAGVSRPAVWRWQQRFAEEGVEGLLRDKTRPPGKAPVPPKTVAQVLALTCSEPPGEVTHWTGRAVARIVGISLRAVQRIWEAHRLQPHRVRTFKRSNDPAFAEKVEDIVGLYMSPPTHAVVLSIDEKSQIQALSRTRLGTPVGPGRPATMTHDYERHGTTTLFAALNVLDGTVLGRCMQRHRHQEFIRFLNRINRRTPPALDLHLIVDNYATHKHPKVRAWLARHPRFHFHFTPTSASWLNAVEGFFAKLTSKRLKRGVFSGIVDLQAAINRFLAEANECPKPFVWTADPEGIIEKVRRGKKVLASIG